MSTIEETYEDRQERERNEETAQLKDLQDRGFRQMFAIDIRVGDIVTKSPGSWMGTWPADRIVAVTRVLPVDATYFDPDENRLLPNTVVHFVGYDENDVEREFAYGHAHAFHIYRGSN